MGEGGPGGPSGVGTGGRPSGTAGRRCPAASAPPSAAARTAAGPRAPAGLNNPPPATLHTIPTRPPPTGKLITSRGLADLAT